VNATTTDAHLTGDFEVHLTLTAGTDVPDATTRKLADQHGLTFIHIRLDRGATPSQPMFTGRASGTLTHLRRVADGWSAALRAEGLDVVRVKIEAAPWCRGIPATDEQAADEPGERYFEHHVKLLLDPADLTGLAALVEPHGAHLSRNARRHRDDGRHERFVTQRCHRVGQPTARERLADLRRALTAAGLTIVEVEEEYVVADDNLTVDAGWLTAREVPA
jgi:hypothetical protein